MYEINARGGLVGSTNALNVAKETLNAAREECVSASLQNLMTEIERVRDFSAYLDERLSAITLPAQTEKAERHPAPIPNTCSLAREIDAMRDILRETLSRLHDTAHRINL
jgi:hypothetical protein